MIDSDKEALINGSATIPYKIYIDGNETPLTERNIISTSYEDFRYVDSDSIVIGQFVARVFTGTIDTINTDLEIENKEITVEMGVKVGSTTNWYSLGNFLITKPTDNDVTAKTTFKAMDYAKKFNKPFDASKIPFPCTAGYLANAVCEQCDVELATTNFTNADFIVENNQYDTSDLCRKVMQDIGKLAYSWVRIGWDNKCYIDFEPSTTVDTYNSITADNYYTLQKQEKKFGPVNRVVVGMKDVDGENVAVEDAESIAENGLCTIYVYDNNLTYTPELRQQVIESAKKLFGFTYTPFESTTTGHPWLLGEELIRFTNVDNSTFNTYAFNRTIEYMGHIKTKLASPGDTQIQQEYVNINSVPDVLTKTKFILDKYGQQITSIVSKTETIEKQTSNNTKEIQTLQTEVTQNKESVSVSISQINKTIEDNKNSIDNINSTIADGVQNVKNSLVTIDINGIHVSTNISAISTIMTNDTFAIQSKGGTYLAYFGYDETEGTTIAKMDNLTVTNYFTAGCHREEKMSNNRTGWFYIG